MEENKVTGFNDQDRANYYEDKIDMLNRVLAEKEKQLQETTLALNISVDALIENKELKKQLQIAITLINKIVIPGKTTSILNSINELHKTLNRIEK